MTEAAKEFWRFSLALYAEPGVAPACLELQDSHGCDVILALYCCWLGASGRGRLDAAAIAAADAALSPWRQRVVKSLRAARREIKALGGPEALYSRAKAVELEAERQAHDILAARAPPPRAGLPAAQRHEDAAASLALYLGTAAGAAAPVLVGLRAII
ncbi:MAG TPA: TIGR02444 family protein [Stellaceae bacterium]|nr:TIGR02444 family protein [Stellaceae bacterium]